MSKSREPAEEIEFLRDVIVRQRAEIERLHNEIERLQAEIKRRKYRTVDWLFD